MPYDPTDLEDALNGLRAWADVIDRLFAERGDAVCAYEIARWREERELPQQAWALLAWAMHLTCLRGYSKHWHPEYGQTDPKRPCTVSLTWVRF